MSSLVKPASTRGKTAPAAAAAAWPGRWSPRSLTLTPSTTVAPSADASGPTASISAVLQRAQRSGPLATYAASSISLVGTPSQRRPHSSASERQSASSAPASEGDSAVTHSTASRPSVSCATLASSDESAPPLNATTTRPRRRSASLRSSSDAVVAVGAVEAVTVTVRSSGAQDRQHVVEPAHHAGVEGTELGVERGGLVEAHFVDAVLQVIGMHTEERHTPLVVVEPGRPGDDLQDAAVEGAPHLPVAHHQLLAGLEVEGVPVVCLTATLAHRVEAERFLGLGGQLG